MRRCSSDKRRGLLAGDDLVVEEMLRDAGFRQKAVERVHVLACERPKKPQPVGVNLPERHILM